MIDEKQALIDELMQHGKTIGHQWVEERDELANEVMQAYLKWTRSPADPVLFVICESAFNKWKAKNVPRSTAFIEMWLDDPEEIDDESEGGFC